MYYGIVKIVNARFHEKHCVPQRPRDFAQKCVTSQSLWKEGGGGGGGGGREHGSRFTKNKIAKSSFTRNKIAISRKQYKKCLRN